MAKYAGETFRIRVTGTDYDGAPITQTDVAEATVDIYDATGTVILDEQPLTWDATKKYWYYDWATDVVTGAGTFKLRARFAGVNFETWEYGRLQIKTNPVTP